jgi:Ca2+/Na+ antiporter
MPSPMPKTVGTARNSRLSSSWRACRLVLCGLNLVELVIPITALGSGLYGLVVVSVAGAVITNCLLVLGISTIWAGRRQKKVKMLRPTLTTPL